MSRKGYWPGVGEFEFSPEGYGPGEFDPTAFSHVLQAYWWQWLGFLCRFFGSCDVPGCSGRTSMISSNPAFAFYCWKHCGTKWRWA